MAEKPEKRDVFAGLTEKVIEALEKGQSNGSFEMPWHQTSGNPYNPVSGTRYRGVNHMSLMIDQSLLGKAGDEPAWATFGQWQSIGAQVRKGERAIGQAVVWREVKLKEQEIDPKTGEPKKGLFPIAMPLFHSSQVEGWTPENRRAPEPFESHAAIEDMVAAYGIEVRPGTQAAYVTTPDFSREWITMPEKGNFFSNEEKGRTAEAGYYGTLLHELVHSTRHPDRLDRPRDGTIQGYAREELVAEMGSVFLSSEFGLAPPDRVREDHVQYVESWLKALRDDKTILRDAAKDAAKAAEMLKTFVPEIHREKLGILTKEDEQRLHEARQARLEMEREDKERMRADGVAGLPHAAADALRFAADQPRVEHVTGKGKVLTGVVICDPDFGKDHAKIVDPYTFAKDGGHFIRDKDLRAALETLDREESREVVESADWAKKTSERLKGRDEKDLEARVL